MFKQRIFSTLLAALMVATVPVVNAGVLDQTVPGYLGSAVSLALNYHDASYLLISPALVGVGGFLAAFGLMYEDKEPKPDRAPWMTAGKAQIALGGISALIGLVLLPKHISYVLEAYAKSPAVQNAIDQALQTAVAADQVSRATINSIIKN